MNDCKFRRNKNALKMNKQSDSIKEGRKTGQKLKPRETEKEAAIRRFHDAQRMARFRARKRKALEEAKALEARKITELSVISLLNRRNISFRPINSAVPPASVKQIQMLFPMRNSTSILVHPVCEQSKYSQLLTRIRELGKDIKLTYASNKISAERLKIGIIKARMLIKECLMETNEMNLQQ